MRRRQTYLIRFFDSSRLGAPLVFFALLSSCDSSEGEQPSDAGQGTGGNELGTTKVVGDTSGGTQNASVPNSTAAGGSPTSFAGAPATGGVQGPIAGANAVGGAPDTVVTTPMGGTSSSNGCSGPEPFVPPTTAIDRCFSEKDCRLDEYCHFETCRSTCNCVTGTWICRAGGCFSECRVKG